MVQPRLLHPVPITIEKVEIDTTIVDDDFREPIQHADREAAVIVDGQVKWGVSDELKMGEVGVEDLADGYVLFRYIDLEAQSIVLEKNDRFTKLGKLDTEVYVVKLRPVGHYTDQGGATMVKAFFSERLSKQGDTEY